MASAVDARRCYVVAGVCLLIAAAALRFYNLPGAAPGFDETRDAVRSRGTFSEVIEYTRYVHSSPILYPAALWAVQKAASTELSMRLMPAAASLLTVWALLFLMPRAGAGRWAAFLAALLAALSVAAIEHAQDGRVYSVDALIAALMIAGLLQYLRDGRKGLLCAALFAGPLLQYGLVLFGVAALGAAAIAAAAAQTGDGGGRRSYGGAVWRHIRRRIELLLPIGAFAAACGLSWALTTRYQWALGVGGAGGNDPGSFYLTDYYYQGGYDAAAMAEFAIGRTWGMLSYHMPPIIAGAALLAFGWLLLSMALRRRLDAVAVLALLAVGIAICAALLGAYPYGHTRQSLYLGPIVFLAAGAAFHSVGVYAVGLARRKRPAAALAVAAAVAIALAGAWEIRQRQDYLYYSDASMKRVVAALEELEREGDGVYAATEEVIYLQFYKGAKPDNYRYGYFFCSEKSYARCVRQTLDEMFRVFNDSQRIWLIHNAGISAPKEIAAYSREGITVEEYAAGGQSDYGGTLHGKPRTTLHLITGFEGLVAGARDEWVEAASGAAVVESDYSVYIRDNALYYARQPCVAADVEAKFFLHVYPLDAGDLPPADRGAGFDNLDFNARDYDLWIGDKCLIRRALPDYYLIERIHTGQFMLDGGIVWEAEFPFDGWFNMYDEVTSGAALAASIYDFYIRGNVLYYAKRPCAAADVDARFFLAIHPQDEADLPAERRRHGFDNLDFEFRDYGARDADKCLIRRALPDYPIERIHTGQFILDGPIIWESEFPFNP